MAVSPDDLREILRDHTSQVAASPFLAADVEGRGRRERRRAQALATAGLVLVLVAALGLVVPRLGRDASPVPPVQSPSPSSVATVSHAAVVDGLSVRTVGPAALDGDTPFEVTVTLSNPTGTPWTGTVGVGVSRSLQVTGATDTFISSLPQGTADSTGTIESFSVLLADGRTVIDGMNDSTRVTVAPNASVVLVRRGQRYLGSAAYAPNHGWIPMLTPSGAHAPVTPDPATYPLVPVAPQGSSSPCATVTIGSATRTPDGAWTLTDAATATSTSATDRPRWTAVRGLGGAVSPTLTSVTPADADFIPVVAGLAAYGIAPASGSGSPQDPPPVTPGTAGDLVSYNGVKQFTVTFTGSCSPSGAAVSGQLRTFDHQTGGILDCSLVPPAGSLGREAARFCPAGSRARSG